MNVYLQPPAGLSLGIQRVGQQLARTAPKTVTVVDRQDQADLTILHVIGYPETAQRCHQILNEGRSYAIVQYCLRTTQRPHSGDWLPWWQGARAVWSYYDLAAALEADVRPYPHSWRVRFHHAPLGVDADLFQDTPAVPRRFTALTSGYIAETECAGEVAAAVKLQGGRQFHLGPDLGLGDHVTSLHGFSDIDLAGVYRSCQWVTGLRRIEGFELPAAEGLLCGARAVVFDRPHYRRWFEGLATFIPEDTPAAVTAALANLFSEPARPLTPSERTEAMGRFSWDEVCRGFWAQVLR